MNPLLYVDFYKPHHARMYPEGMTFLYSNFTPRKSRLTGIDAVVTFGVQHFIIEYLQRAFNEEFFNVPLELVLSQYSRHVNVNLEGVKALHELGYLPILVKALPEGTLCPIGVPMLTIENTHPNFAWLTNYLETLLSCMLWQPITSATIAHQYKKLLDKYALETTGTTEGVEWQGHDFSMRGMSSVESAILSGMGHLLSFTGTDTIPAIYQLEQSYGATGLIGASVPATEHSVMCMGEKATEIETFERLLTLYPEGILSVVSDTWDLWKVCTEYLPQLKEKILARNGKLVIRPDSGNPVDIICGEIQASLIPYTDEESLKIPANKGVIELLWDTFGGTINEQGYKVLDPHIGAIYGDSITLERAEQICERLKAKGFASTNIVLGIGSFTYQYNTRDTFGFAMKATYGEVLTEVTDCEEVSSRTCIDSCQGSCSRLVEVGREIFKDPITDDGTKKSKKGLLRVGWDEQDGKAGIYCKDQQTKEECDGGMLRPVFKDGKLLTRVTLEQVRKTLKEQ